MFPKQNKSQNTKARHELLAKLTHLWMFTPHMSTHGCSGRNLCPTQLTALGFHLIVSELYVFLEHVISDILLITD